MGANITSKKKVPLCDIIKPLASQKKLNISWASDVIQNIDVDVDINADDDFYQALENLLRQVDYFYEIQGSTLVIKYKETRKFHIAMPFKAQQFNLTTGGNSLGANGQIVSNANSGIEGTILLSSDNESSTNKFDIWENIQLNLDTILNLETVRTNRQKVGEGKSVKETGAENKEIKTTDQKIKKEEKVENAEVEEKELKKEAERFRLDEEKRLKLKKRLAEPKGNYIIDKPVGLITVTAPRKVMKEIEAYISSLENEIYKQISIEAKIIEVQLLDSSSIGINWDSVLKNFNIKGAVEFGAQTLGNGVTSVGQVFPYVFANENAAGTWNDGTNHGSTYDPTRFVSNIRINTANFDVFLNALKTQGNTKVLSNPKISVLNGQPAMISVGKSITYINSVAVKKGTVDSPGDTYTPTTASILSGISLGLTATVMDNNEIIINLVPITSELVDDTIEYKMFADGSQVGLPIVNVREMNTMARVKDGEMLVIGGLISDRNDEQGNFAPVLGDIPLLKYLFGHEEKIKSKRELIILLKPRII
ncbi:MAG: pilus (MSHA type) biogenesis protein MshL [Desulfocapsaceae bacterium]|nr:pilus (MSHA type) biogenesis protein MshL [Desulfocapsaceae bacterium]